MALTSEERVTLLTEALPHIRKSVRKGLGPIVDVIGAALVDDLASGGQGSVTALLNTLFGDKVLAKNLYEAFSRIRKAKPISIPTADPKWCVAIHVPTQSGGDERPFTFDLIVTPITRDHDTQGAAEPPWLHDRLQNLLVHASPVVGFAPLATNISVHAYSQSLQGKMSFELLRVHPAGKNRRTWTGFGAKQALKLDVPGVYRIEARWRDRIGRVHLAVLDPEMGGRSVVAEKLNDRFNIDVIPEVGDLNTVFRFRVSGRDKFLKEFLHDSGQTAARYLWSIGQTRIAGGLTDISVTANEQWVIQKEHLIRFSEPGVYQIELRTDFYGSVVTFGTAWAIVCDNPTVW